jgi:hypothetical protein
MTSRPGARFVVYSSSAGGYYVREIRHLLACGLRAAGFQAREADERRGFLENAGWHLVVSPQEFFSLGSGKSLRAAPWPTGVILYNTAQPDSAAFSFIRKLLPRAHAIWDMDLSASKLLARGGWRSSHVPLGWVQGCRLFPPKRMPHERRPLDALFVGSRTARRDRFFRTAAPLLAGLRALVHAPDGPPPIQSSSGAARNTRTFLGLARRAKIVLNVHRRDSAYFEWHRVVIHGLAQGALVISEPTTAAPPLRPGRDFVTAPLKKFPEMILRHISSPRGRNEAATIAARGWRTYRRSCRLADSLKTAVKALSHDEGTKARQARRREQAARELLRGLSTPSNPRSGRRRRRERHA